jgi:hypothetical protein
MKLENGREYTPAELKDLAGWLDPNDKNAVQDLARLFMALCDVVERLDSETAARNA